MEANGDVTVQAGSINDLSSDAFLVLPLAALGYEYYVMCYQYMANTKYQQGPSQFGVVGTRKDTRVTILLPASNPDIEFDLTTRTRIRRIGRTLRLTMDAYETLQVRLRSDMALNNIWRRTSTMIDTSRYYADTYNHSVVQHLRYMKLINLQHFYEHTEQHCKQTVVTKMEM